MAQLGSLGTEKLSNLPRPHSYKMMESGSEPGSMTPKPLFFPSGSSVTSICCHVGKHTPPTPPSMFMGDFPPHGPTASQRLSPRALLLLGFHSIPTLCLPPQKKMELFGRVQTPQRAGTWEAVMRLQQAWNWGSAFAEQAPFLQSLFLVLG